LGREGSIFGVKESWDLRRRKRKTMDFGFVNVYL